MSNLSDKEIDRLSREAADLFEPDDSSLAWSRLEQRLSEQMPGRPPDRFGFGRTRPYFWGAAVILFTGFSFFLIKNNFYSKDSTRTPHTSTAHTPQTVTGQNRDNPNLKNTEVGAAIDDRKSARGEKSIQPGIEKSVQPGSEKSIQPGIEKSVQPGGLTSDNRLPDEKGITSEAARVHKPINTPGVSQAEANTTKNSKAATLNKSGLSAGEAAERAPTHDPASRNAPVATIRARNRNDLHGAGSEEAIAKIRRKPGSASSSGISSGEESQELQTADGNASGLLTTHVSRERSFRSGTSGTLPELIVNRTGPGRITRNDSLLNKFSLAAMNVPGKSLRINRSLNFGFAFGADYTDASDISNNQFGNDIGVTIGYYLTKKLSLNTGVLYSNKFYWSPGHGQGVPQATSYSPQVNASALVVYAAAPPIEFKNNSVTLYEIPLTLRYDVAQSNKTRFFVNAGLSSYIIIKQTSINFFHAGGNILAWKTTDPAQANHWMQVADVSAGLETEVGKGFSFQVEPFLKLPLQRMGVENLKLNSYGILFSFRYAPVLSRSRK